MNSTRRARSSPGGALGQALALTLAILLVEVAAGLLAHSLALLADAGHMLTDAFALALAWFAVVQSRRPADERRTYGYHRAGILAALANAVLLILILGPIAFEAVHRLGQPAPVNGLLMLASALVAVLANAYISARLHGHRADMGVRAAALHVTGDLVASGGVAVAALVILATGWTYADPLLSLGVAALIAWSAVRLCLDSLHVLLEGTPKGLDLAAVRSELESLPDVIGVHDLHVWSLSAQETALSCHIVVRGELSASEGEHLVRDLETRVCGRFAIGHTTVQVETCHPCTGDEPHGSGMHNHPHARLEAAAQPVLQPGSHDPG